MRNALFMGLLSIILSFGLTPIGFTLSSNIERECSIPSLDTGAYNFTPAEVDHNVKFNWTESNFCRRYDDNSIFFEGRFDMLPPGE